MTHGIAGFIGAWSPSYKSTMHRVELRNVRQGGNDILAVVPLACQSMWAGILMSTVASVVAGPLHYIAQIFSYAFSGCINFPLSILSSSVKAGLYEASAGATAAEKTQYFRKGAVVQQPIEGTVTLLVDGQERYFRLGNDVSNRVRETVVDQDKRYTFHRLDENEIYDEKCRTVDIEDEQGVRIKLLCEIPDCKYIERDERGIKRCYELENEVTEPVQGTVTEREWNFEGLRETHYLLELTQQEDESCVKIKAKEMTLYYDTGLEIDAPIDGSRTFAINGDERHFISAKYVKSKSIGMSGYLNLASDKFLKFSILPTRLSRFSAKALSLINKYWSDVIRIAVVVSGVVFAVFGHMSLALGTLFAVTYEYLDHDLGIIPQKVSLFMEQWLPVVSMSGLLIVGSITSQIMAGTTLLLMIPQVKLFFHHKVAQIIRKALLNTAEFLSMLTFSKNAIPREVDQIIESIKSYPQLEECEAPFTQRKDMNAAEIREILELEVGAFEINPASLTHNVKPLLDLDQDRNFNKLSELWDQSIARWESEDYYNASYRDFLETAAQNPHFIRCLKEQIPEAQASEYVFNSFSRDPRALRLLEGWVQQLAEQRGVCKEKFVADWLNYHRFLRRIADDNRFIEFLKTRYPEVKRFNFRPDDNLSGTNQHHIPDSVQERIAKVQFIKDIEDKIESLSQEKQMSKEAFVFDWVKAQMRCYIDKLSGNKPIEGEQRYLRDTMENTAKIIPFLTRADATPVNVEDVLLKLAIEGGDYCALGMRRASEQVLEGYTEPLILTQNNQLNSNQRLEHDVIQGYQKGRQILIDLAFHHLSRLLLNREELIDTAEDIHLYMALSRAVKRGVYPMSANEMEDYSMAELLFSEAILIFPRIGFKKMFEMGVDLKLAGYDKELNPNWGQDAFEELDNEQETNLITETEQFIRANRISPIEFSVENLSAVMQGLDLEREMESSLEDVRTALLRRLIGQNRFLNYLRAWVNENSALSALEKQNLLNGILADTPEALNEVRNYQKWHRLFLTVIGIFRKKEVVEQVSTAATTVLQASPA